MHHGMQSNPPKRRPPLPPPKVHAITGQAVQAQAAFYPGSLEPLILRTLSQAVDTCAMRFVTPVDYSYGLTLSPQLLNSVCTHAPSMP